VRTFAYVHPYTPANSPNDLGGYWIKVHKIFISHRGIIVNVKATTDIAIFLSNVECQCTE